MGFVKLLPETVQNKIAAGEVVERPASVVKELVENAIDAGATTISVDLEDGGHRLIRVSDNGSGMSEEDLVLALERHATSKIADVDDIFHITSLGFRGEALPSIASVSRTTITTCLPGQTVSSQIQVDGGITTRLSPEKSRRGTVVEVRDIFFNTPARRKFLKAPSSDNRKAAEVVTRLALAYPDLGFRLQLDGKIAFAVHPAADQLERIRDIFGDARAKKLLPIVRDSAEGVSVSGFIGAPPQNSRSMGDMYFLVNRRWIKHVGLAKAVANAYKDSLPPRSYPFAIINLAIDPERLDVNAHPTKEEIRFDNEYLVKSSVTAAVGEALRSFAIASASAGISFSAMSGQAEKSARQEIAPASSLFSAQAERSPHSTPARRGDDFSQTDLAYLRERMRTSAAPARVAGRDESAAMGEHDAETPDPGAAKRVAAAAEASVLRRGTYKIIG